LFGGGAQNSAANSQGRAANLKLILRAGGAPAGTRFSLAPLGAWAIDESRLS